MAKFRRKTLLPLFMVGLRLVVIFCSRRSVAFMIRTPTTADSPFAFDNRKFHGRRRKGDFELSAQARDKGARHVESFSTTDQEVMDVIRSANTTIQLDEILRNINGSEFANLKFPVATTALRRMAYIAVSERRINGRSGATSSLHDPSLVQEKRQSILTGLIKSIGTTVIVGYRSNDNENLKSNNSTSDSTAVANTHALADTLEALAILARQSNSGKENMQPIAKIVVGLMSRVNESELYLLGPTRLVKCLQAMSTLDVPSISDKSDSGDKAYDEGYRLQQSILRLLVRPDLLGKLSAHSMSYGLEAIAATSSFSSRANGMDPLASKFTKHLMRRLRKTKVRQHSTTWDNIRALRAVERLVFNNNYYSHDDGVSNEIAEEAPTFAYTIIQGMVTTNQNETNTAFCVKLSADQIIDTLSAWTSLRQAGTSLTDDPIVSSMLSELAAVGPLDTVSYPQLTKLLTTLRRLKANDCADVFKAAGWRLLDLVNDCNRDDVSSLLPQNDTFDPAKIYEMFRSTVLLYRKDNDVMEPFLCTALILFTDAAFLARCKVSELANFLWFMSMAKWHDANVLEGLVRRILDPEVVQSCTPKLASRILGTFVSLLFSPGINVEEDESQTMTELYFLASDLFHEYGGHLLSSQLSPAEVSSALYAYAKISYVRDMGIYDHLVSLIATYSDKCTTRQLSQSLWSCGKMAMWESSTTVDNDEMEDNNKTQDPPYLNNAKHLADALAVRAKELSPIDVAQSIWSLARLDIKDARIVCSFAYRAEEIAARMNSAELANSLWGLCKVGFNDQQVIESLSHRITLEELRATPQEAANVLYALGTLKVHNKPLYANLTNIMLEQIERASAQAVANALWAHRNVKIPPPQELLDRWAMQKIGIVGISAADL